MDPLKLLYTLTTLGGSDCPACAEIGWTCMACRRGQALLTQLLAEAIAERAGPELSRHRILDSQRYR